MKVCRRETFNAAHRLHNPRLSDTENKELFGLCNSPNYHGHNYALEVWVDGPINAVSGYIIDLKELSTIIHQEVLDPFDHRNLNLDCEEFKNLNPTAENIAYVIWNKLRKRIEAKYQLEIRLWETDRNSVFFDGR